MVGLGVAGDKSAVGGMEEIATAHHARPAVGIDDAAIAFDEEHRGGEAVKGIGEGGGLGRLQSIRSSCR